MAEWVKVATTDQVSPGAAMVVSVQGKEIALFNREGTFYAIGNTCTHAEGPLAEGEVEGDEVTCPWHGACFNIKTGEVVGPPASENVPCFKVAVEGNDIKVEIP